jgi:ABC-type lipoprotein release transport system permease subunit
MILKIAWKNVWRKKMRSAVVIASISIGLTGGIVYMGIMNAMISQRIDTAVNTEISHIQIHNEKFLENEEIEYSIDNNRHIIENIKNNDKIKAYAGRIISMGMASTARTGTGVKILGIEVEKESLLTNLHTKLIDSSSSYFTTRSRYPILIGQKLANKLKAKIKSKIILTFQAASGELTGGAFKVVGIYKTSNSTYDGQSVFVKKKDLAKLTGIPIDTNHEIAIMLKDDINLSYVCKELNKKFPNSVSYTWQETMPELGMMVESMDYMLYIFMIIILTAVAFGIVNTMLMVVFERTKELGMLMCIGLNRKKVFLMIIFETILLSLTGGLIGLISSALIIQWLGNTGLDISIVSEGLEVWGYDSVLYPYVDGSFYLGITALVCITAIISALYPARKAITLNPVEAVRIDA